MYLIFIGLNLWKPLLFFPLVFFVLLSKINSNLIVFFSPMFSSLSL